MASRRAAYIQARTELLERITRMLREDERIVAAWLSGSFGRGEETWLSDLDLHVIVSDAFSTSLCTAPWNEAAKTTPERLALFSQFGTPGLIYERLQHASYDGGILTNVVYQESGQSVDWLLIPQAIAHRESPSLLLFDKVGLPEPPSPEPERPEERVERLSRQVGFFWIIACGSARALAGSKLALFASYLIDLEQALQGVKATLRGDPVPFVKSTDRKMAVTQEACAAILRDLCDEMEGLMPQVVQLGGYVPASPRAVVEMRLALATDERDGTD
ncbi:MAG TPA: nucleotidyltransferase domain-containing protein [Ktedonobacterales bacterium]